jgi:hypothetical protein
MRTGPLFRQGNASLMNKPAKRAGALLALLAVVPMGCSHGSGAGAQPPAVDSRAWTWVAAAPGMNIYVAYRGAPREPGVRSAWVDRRYFSNLAGVNADVIELRRFDCRDGTSRRLGGRAEDGSWPPERELTPSQQVLQTVCERASAQ